LSIKLGYTSKAAVLSRYFVSESDTTNRQKSFASMMRGLGDREKRSVASDNKRSLTLNGCLHKYQGYSVSMATQKKITPSTTAHRARKRRVDAESKEAFKVQIIQIARDLFAQNGYRGVSMRSISAKAGCTPMTLYAYFPNKLALLRFIWVDIFSAVFEQTEAAIGANAEPRDKLRAYSASWIAYWRNHPENYRTVFLNQDTSSEEINPRWAGLDSQFFVTSARVSEHISTLVGVFQAGIDSGALRKISPTVGVKVLLAHLIGISHMLVMIPEFALVAPEDIAIEGVEIGIRGFLAS
jgi:AcrR family transcriptional regulator